MQWQKLSHLHELLLDCRDCEIHHLLSHTSLKHEHRHIDNLLHDGVYRDLRHGFVDNLLHTLRDWHIDVLFDAPSHLHFRVNRGSRRTSSVSRDNARAKLMGRPLGSVAKKKTAKNCHPSCLCHLSSQPMTLVISVALQALPKGCMA